MTTARWVVRGGGAVADQGLTALAHFVMNVLLVRWLSPEEYGSFVIAWTVLLLVGAVHAGFVLEPMVVFASSRYASDPKGYIERVARAQFVVLAALAAVVLAVSLPVSLEPEGAAAVAGVVVAPFVLWLWTARAIPYVALSPQLSARYSATFLILLASGLVLVRRADALGARSALATVAVVSVLACIPLIRSRDIAGPTQGQESPPSRELARQHWIYGRWAAPSRICNWTSLHIFYLILPFLLGTAAAGTLRASVTVLAPFTQTLAALSALLMPILSRQRGRPAFTMLLNRALIAAGITGIVLWFGIYHWHNELLHLIYGGRFESPAGVFLALGGLPLFTGLALFAIAGLRALERTRDVFWALLGSAVATIAVGLPLTQRIGLPGSAVGIVAGAVVAGVIAGGAHVRLSASPGRDEPKPIAAGSEPADDPYRAVPPVS